MEAFAGLGDTYLHQAMATDVELHMATRDQPRGKPMPPQLVEETMVVGLLKTISEQLQALTHWTASAAPPKSHRPKIKKYPRPRTAQEIVARAEARQAYLEVEAAIVRLPEAEWRARTDQHLADGQNKHGVIDGG